MNDSWSIAMLISGALLAAGAVPIAWERTPAWRAGEAADADPGVCGAIVGGVVLERAAGQGQRDRHPIVWPGCAPLTASAKTPSE